MSERAAVTVCALDEIPSGTVRKVTIGNVDVALVRIDDSVYALADQCSHGQVSLSGGEVWCDELELECPKHGSTFSLTNGEPSTLPATQPVAVYDAAVIDGKVVVTLELAVGDSEDNEDNGDDEDDGDDGDNGDNGDNS